MKTLDDLSLPDGLFWFERSLEKSIIAAAGRAEHSRLRRRHPTAEHTPVESLLLHQFSDADYDAQKLWDKHRAAVELESRS